MKNSPRLPLAVSIIAALAYVACTLHANMGLPAYVATHFNATGWPNGWMPQAELVRFELGLGVGTQVFLAVLGGCLRFIPARFVNLPHKEYWQRPENFPTASRLLMHDLLWLGSLMVLWMILLNYLVAQANRVMPARLDTNSFLFAMGTFLVMLFVWSIALWRRFRIPMTAKKAGR